MQKRTLRPDWLPIVNCQLSIVSRAERRGFTLLELALTIGILTFLLALTLSVSTNAIGRSALQSAENVLVQTLRRAQTLAQQNAQQNAQESYWGVYICPGVSLGAGCAAAPASVILYRRIPPANTFTTFSPTSPTNDQAFEINAGITVTGTLYTLMTQAPQKGLTFAPLTGEPVESGFHGTIVLTSGGESRTVTVSQKGVVEH